MKSLAYIPGSNGSANASLMTVQTLRASGASTIIVNTVAGVPAKFYASMGEPHTFVDPVTAEQITMISEATAVDFAGHIDSGKIEIDQIAPGYTDTRGSKVGDIIVIRPVTEWANNLANVLGVSHMDDGSLTPIKELFADNIVPGTGVVAIVSGLTVSISNIAYYMGGVRLTKTSIPNKVLTATKDTYCFIDTAGTITYSEVTVGATAPATPASSILFAVITTNGSTATLISLRGRGAVSADNIDYGSFVAFNARPSGAQTLTTSYSKVNFTLATLNQGGAYDATLSRFVAPTSGLYFFTASLSNNGSNIQLARFYVNGVTENSVYSNIGRTGGSNIPSDVIAMIPLKAGEYVELWAVSNTASSPTESQISKFMGWRVG